ncbi:hypothetical protein BCR41DRAFT_419541, partial [Lobosporangium transversale]
MANSPSLLTHVINFMGYGDARFAPSDWSFEHNPFWTTYLLTLAVFPCLFYFTWYLNPSLSNNRLGLSWVMGFYSACLFTIAGFYEVPHLRTIFNSLVDYQPVSGIIPSMLEATDPVHPSSADILGLSPLAAKDICYPLLKAGTLAFATLLPSFLKLEDGSYSKYYCFSDFKLSDNRTSSIDGGFSSRIYDHSEKSAQRPFMTTASSSFSYDEHDNSKMVDSPLSLRHGVFQAQMQRPHLFFSLENYPDDGRIGPHIIAANFQAFLAVDLILGLMHYRKQLEPFSTVVHHIIYHFIVVHMRAGDMLSVFCICGTPIEASSIFLAFGRIFPHRRTKTIERLYLLCFISTRLIYVALLWHEIFFNYPDKSVAFLYTITLSLHIYWFILYIKTQRKYQAKLRRQQLCSVLQSLANTVKNELTSLGAVEDTKDFVTVSKIKTKPPAEWNISKFMRKDGLRLRRPLEEVDMHESRASVELSQEKNHLDDDVSRGGAQ